MVLSNETTGHGARRLRLFGICSYQGHCSVGVAGDREVNAELYTRQSLYRWFIGFLRNRETREKVHGKERRTCSVVAFSADRKDSDCLFRPW